MWTVKVIGDFIPDYSTTKREKEEGKNEDEGGEGRKETVIDDLYL